MSKKRFTLIHDFGHIELDILLSLLEAVQRGLRIENRNLSEIRLLLLLVLSNVSNSPPVRAINIIYIVPAIAPVSAK